MKQLLIVIATFFTFSGWMPASAAPTAEELVSQFVAPPESARPWVFCEWMNGNVTREGITADLEAMARVGIGGMNFYNVTYDIPPGRVDFMSPRWRELFIHMVREADRLGLQVITQSADGWSAIGGPWVTLEQSMQVLTSRELAVAGPRALDAVLPMPPSRMGFYRDVAVYAFPGGCAAMRDFSPKLTASDSREDLSKLVDGDPETGVTLPAPSMESPQWIKIELVRPFSARSLHMVVGPGRRICRGRLEVSDDGVRFRSVRDVQLGWRGDPATLGLSFPAVTGRFFRLMFDDPGVAPMSLVLPDNISLREIELSSRDCVDNWPQKAGQVIASGKDPDLSHSSSVGIRRDTMIDLTDRLGADGRLRWDVPAGSWTILRLGHTTTGILIHPATPAGEGLESDHLSRQAIENHFEAFVGKLISDVGPLAGKSFAGVFLDSWELGTQNWTPKFREEFLRLRGYDPKPYLPAMVGVPVESTEVTERFLFDVRRTIADLFADNYEGHLRELLHRHGMWFSTEAYGGAFDTLQCAARSDISASEFWVCDPSDIRANYFKTTGKQAASTAHQLGQTVVGGEAFSSHPTFPAWQEHPGSLKALGDGAFCTGVNRFLLSNYAMQPWLDRRPGMTFGSGGCHFDRNCTWFEQGRAWLKYLARCQYLLQQGQAVADLCYFVGEPSPNSLGARKSLKPTPPSSLDYDGCHREMIQQMEVHDGPFVLPSGMSYRLLVLPGTRFMTPQLLHKINDLVRAGGHVVGQKPQKSPSLEGYPACDGDVAREADVVWGSCDGKKITEHALGKGKVYWGKPLETILAELGVQPDFECASNKDPAELLWTHRRNGEVDLYFISNQRDASRSIEATFRVDHKLPELWDPETGRIEEAAIWFPKGDGRTTVRFRLEPHGSVFVVFRRLEGQLDPIVAVTRNDAPLEEGVSSWPAAFVQRSAGRAGILAVEPGRYEARTAAGRTVTCEVHAVPATIELAGEWEVRFPPGWGAPASAVFDKLTSWTERPEEGIKYFSGTAVYRKAFDLPSDRLGADKSLYLDLGAVEVIAQVILNGHDLGIYWKAPFRVEVGGVAKAGRNDLEIRITNLWPNRLIGDEQKPPYLKFNPKGTANNPKGRPLEWPAWVADGGPVPETGRYTFATWKHYSADSPLLTSGLLGPVTLRSVERRNFDLKRESSIHGK